MNQSGPRFVLFCGLMSSIILCLVGVFLTVFGYANYVSSVMGLGRWINFWAIFIGLIGLHCIPLLLFLVAMGLRGQAKRWLGLVFLLLSPATAAIGFDGLFLRGDWGDTVLWAPYLLTGLFMAAAGGQIVFRRVSR